MAMNLEYFYATEVWNDSVANFVKETYKEVYNINIEDYINQNVGVCTMWQELVDDIFGRERYPIRTASDIDDFFKINQKNHDFLNGAIDRYELYEIDVWIMASLTIAYLEHHTDDNIPYTKEELAGYMPEIDDNANASYLRDFENYIKKFILYERKYGRKIEDYDTWRRKRATTKYKPKDYDPKYRESNKVTGKIFTKLSFVKNFEYDRLRVSYALKRNRKEYHDAKKTYISEEVYFITDSVIETNFNANNTTEDCLMFAKYVNPELVRRFYPLVFSDEINKYCEIIKYNSLTWQHLVTALLFKIRINQLNDNIDNSKIFRVSDEVEPESKMSISQPKFLDEKELNEIENNDWTFMLNRRAEKFLNKDYILEVNDKLRNLSLGLLYLYYNSGNKVDDKATIYQEAVASYIALHDENFMKITPVNVSVLINDIRNVLQEDTEISKEKLTKKIKDKGINYDIFEDPIIAEMIVEYCMKNYYDKGKLALNLGDNNLLTAYAYLQEITIKLIQSRFMG